MEVVFLLGVAALLVFVIVRDEWERRHFKLPIYCWRCGCPMEKGRVDIGKTFDTTTGKGTQHYEMWWECSKNNNHSSNIRLEENLSEPIESDCNPPYFSGGNNAIL